MYALGAATSSSFLHIFLEQEMATSAEILCEICDGQDITRRAEHWCPECEGGLCSECLKHHSISKASRSHQVVSVENIKKLPKHISEIVHHCPEHDRKYQNYCPAHESLCCPACIATAHKECIGLLILDDIIKTSKTSSMLEALEEDISDLKRNVELIVKDIDENKKTNKQIRETFLCDIKKVRSDMNNHFDKLEERVKKEVVIAEQKINKGKEKIYSEIKEKWKEFDELERDITAIKQYASDLQTCLGSMAMKKKVDTERKYIQSLVENGELKQVLLKCGINDQLLQMTLLFNSFGSVSTEQAPSSVKLITEKTKRAQILSPPQRLPTDIMDINLTKKLTFDIPSGKSRFITGCKIDSNGKILLTDFLYNKILLFNDTGTMENQVDLSTEYPTDITFVDDKTVCVSFASNDLQLINTDTYTTTQVIQTKGKCFGTTYNNGTLLWCEVGSGIQMKHLATNTVTTLVRLNDYNFGSYITVFDDKIYHTRCRLHTITCYNINGEKIWEFKDETVILNPYGIAVDNDSNVYVTSDTQHKVVVISPDGKRSRRLLGENGLKNPSALYFDRKRSILLVACLEGPIFMFNVSHCN